MKANFGDGSDGTVNLDGTNNFGFANLAGGVYTLTRDVFANTMTLSNNVTLKPRRLPVLKGSDMVAPILTDNVGFGLG